MVRDVQFGSVERAPELLAGSKVVAEHVHRPLLDTVGFWELACCVLCVVWWCVALSCCCWRLESTSKAARKRAQNPLQVPCHSGQRVALGDQSLSLALHTFQPVVLHAPLMSWSSLTRIATRTPLIQHAWRGSRRDPARAERKGTTESHPSTSALYKSTLWHLSVQRGWSDGHSIHKQDLRVVIEGVERQARVLDSPEIPRERLVPAPHLLSKRDIERERARTSK